MHKDIIKNQKSYWGAKVFRTTGETLNHHDDLCDGAGLKRARMGDTYLGHYMCHGMGTTAPTKITTLSLIHAPSLFQGISSTIKI